MNRKGFTLIETLVAVLIFSIMGTGIMFFIAKSNTVLNNGVKQTFAHTNGVRILNMLAEDIREGCIIQSNNGNYNGCIITMPDSTVVTWGYNFSSTEDGYKARVTRDGKEVLFYGDMGKTSNYDYVYLTVTPRLLGEYFFANINIKIKRDDEEVDITTTTYCRHDPTGYGFSPADYIVIN